MPDVSWIGDCHGLCRSIYLLDCGSKRTRMDIECEKWSLSGRSRRIIEEKSGQRPFGLFILKTGPVFTDVPMFLCSMFAEQ